MCDRISKKLARLAAAVAAMLAASALQAEDKPLPRALRAPRLPLATFVRFSPDGRYLVSYHFTGGLSEFGPAGSAIIKPPNADGPNLVAMWDVTQSKLLWQQKAVPELALAGLSHLQLQPLDFSADSALLVGPAPEPVNELRMSKEMGLYDASTGRLQHVCKSKQEAATSFFGPLALSRDGELLAFAVYPDSAELWNPKTATQKAVLRQPNPSLVLEMLFSPDGRTLATYGQGQAVDRRADGVRARQNGEVRLDLWDTATCRLRHSQKLTNCPAGWAYSADGKLLAVSEAERLTVFDVASGQTRQAIKARGGHLALADDGNSATILSEAVNQLCVSVVKLDGKRNQVTLEKDLGDEATIRSAILFAGGARLAVAVEAPSPFVAFYETQTGRELAMFRTTAKRKDQPYHFAPVMAGINSALMGSTGAISPDNRTFATARFDGAIDLWPVP